MKIQKLDFNNIKFIKNACVAALFTGAAILFFGCENNNLEEIKAFTTTDNLPIVEAEDFESLVTDSGLISFYLKAPKLLKFDREGKTYLEFPEGIELVRYDANHKMESSITADYAMQYVVEDKWEAKNNVVATNATGDTLKTEHLIYEVEKEKIYTDEYVKIIQSDHQVITGIGFESDQKMQNWKIKNPKGTIYIAVEEGSESVNSSDTVPREKAPLKIETDSKPFDKPLEFEQK